MFPQKQGNNCRGISEEECSKVPKAESSYLIQSCFELSFCFVWCIYTPLAQKVTLLSTLLLKCGITFNITRDFYSPKHFSLFYVADGFF